MILYKYDTKVIEAPIKSPLSFEVDASHVGR